MVRTLSALCFIVVLLDLVNCRMATAGPTRIVGLTGILFVEPEETLLDIARAQGLGILELMAANPGVDPWIPGEGQRILLPQRLILPDARERGIVINLAERRLYFFADGQTEVQSWAIGIGRLAFTTPLGQSRIVRKATDPTWRPTEETRADNPELPAVVPPGPDNPMGRFALYLGWPQYAIHGTNQPWGIGRRVSRGCIRLYPESIEALYGQVAVGTRVTVVDQTAKLAWHLNKLYLEVHPDRAQLDALEETGSFPAKPVDGLMGLIIEAVGERAVRLDFEAIAQAERERRGVPVVIAQ
jgi:L,D-transpeptidase ErfK/SrfK